MHIAVDKPEPVFHNTLLGTTCMLVRRAFSCPNQAWPSDVLAAIIGEPDRPSQMSVAYIHHP
jgi:hypothetical protein